MEAAETAKKEAVKARSVKKGNSGQKGKQRSSGSNRGREAKPGRRGESQRARERHRESYRRDYDREYDRGTIKSTKSGKYLHLCVFWYTFGKYWGKDCRKGKGEI